MKRAFIVDINPLCRGLIRRVLIDKNGLTFVPTYGWCHLGKQYKVFVLPGTFTFTSSEKWVNMFRPVKNSFQHCYVQNNWVFAT